MVGLAKLFSILLAFVPLVDRTSCFLINKHSPGSLSGKSQETGGRREWVFNGGNEIMLFHKAGIPGPSYVRRWKRQHVISATNTSMGTQLQISLTDLNKQVLDTGQYLQNRQDNQLEQILQLIAGRFDRVEAQINNVEAKLSRVEKDLGAQIGKVEKDLGAQIGKVEKDVAYIRAAGTVIIVLATLAFKVPPSVWENLGLVS